MLHKLTPLFTGMNRATAAAPVGSHTRDDRAVGDLLDGLWQETLNVAVKSTAVASLLNGLERTGSALDHARAEAVLELARSDLPISKAIIAKVLATPLPVRTVVLLRALYDLISVGRSRIEELAARQHTGHSPARRADAQRAALQQAAEIWREIAGTALSLIYDLELAALQAVPELAIEATSELAAALREARNGGSPCLDVAGRPFMPYWAQKRADRRHRIRRKAHVEHGSVVHAAEIRDVSARGLGIACHSKLVPGSVVTMILGDGERLTATVMWSAAGRSGLQLARPLHDGHELFSGKGVGITAS